MNFMGEASHRDFLRSWPGVECLSLVAERFDVVEQIGLRCGSRTVVGAGGNATIVRKVIGRQPH